MEEKKSSFFVLSYFLILFLISILLMGSLLWPFMSILVLSFVLAGIFQPVYLYFKNRFSEHFASLLTSILIVFLVFLPFIFLIGALSQEAITLFQMTKDINFGDKIDEISAKIAWFNKVHDIMESRGISLETEGVSNTLSDFARMTGLFIYKHATSWAANIMGFIFSFLIMIIAIFFLLIDKETLVNYLVRLSPLPDEHDLRLLRRFEEVATAVLVGNGICGLIQGVIGGIVFGFLNFNSPLLWGGIMGILAFLPIVGIGLVLIPAAIVLLLDGNLSGALGMMIFYMLLSFSIEYLLKPKLVGGQVKMHTLLVFLAILGGLAVYGVLGIIYGPLIVIAFLTLADIYNTEYSTQLKGRILNKNE
jgi:predicted PurR-regulated permease PerM